MAKMKKAAKQTKGKVAKKRGRPAMKKKADVKVTRAKLIAAKLKLEKRIAAKKRAAEIKANKAARRVKLLAARAVARKKAALDKAVASFVKKWERKCLRQAAALRRAARRAATKRRSLARIARREARLARSK